MVARVISRKSIRGLLNYNERKVAEGQAQLIMGSGFARDMPLLGFNQKLRRFEQLTMLNGRVKANALHIMLNFDPSEKMDNGTLQRIAASYMEKIGFGEQPYLVYRHYDAGHPHIHLVTTNIRSDGSRIDLHNLGKTLSEKARKELEVEYGLVRAEGKQREKIDFVPLSALPKSEYGERPAKQYISSVVTAAIGQYAFTSLGELNALLRPFHLEADRGRKGSRMYQQEGLVFSFLDRYGNRKGIPFRASSLPGKPTLNRLQYRFGQNKKKRIPFRQALITAIGQALGNGNVTKEAFAQRLREQGVEVVFRENGEGLTYGVTFVDHRNKTVFNGSSLGKAFGAKALSARLSPSPAKETLSSRDQPSRAPASLAPYPGESQDGINLSGNDRLLENLFAKPGEGQLPLLPRRKGKKRKRRFRL